MILNTVLITIWFLTIWNGGQWEGLGGGQWEGLKVITILNNNYYPQTFPNGKVLGNIFCVVS